MNSQYEDDPSIMPFSNSIILLHSLVTGPASHTFTRKIKTYGLTKTIDLSMLQQQCPRNIIQHYSNLTSYSMGTKKCLKIEASNYNLSMIKGQRRFYIKPHTILQLCSILLQLPTVSIVSINFNRNQQLWKEMQIIR